jgi:hypothetical protein
MLVEGYLLENLARGDADPTKIGKGSKLSTKLE